MGYDNSLANLKGMFDIMAHTSPLNLSGDAFVHTRVISGFKSNVSTTVMDDITMIPGTTTIPYPNGIQLKVFSSATSDALSGIGAQKIEIHYLDTNYNELEETIIMNGTTPVNTVATDIHRIQHFYVKQVGSNGIPTGNISLTNLAGTVTYDYITEANQSLYTGYTIPKNHWGFILGWHGTSTKQPASLRLRATCSRYDRTLLPGVFIIQDVVNVNNSSSGHIPFDVPLRFPPMTDIKISALGGAGGSDVSGSFVIMLMTTDLMLP